MTLLPHGYHHGLHIVRDIHSDAGPTIGDGGPKGVLHITVSNERHVHAARDILVAEGFESNVLLGYDLHTMRPYLYQLLQLNRTGKALEHPAGTPPTNGGGIIVCQMEIAAEVADVAHFDDIGFYRVLANAWGLINLSVSPNIPSRLWSPVVSRRSAERLSAGAYITASGYGGHRNVPNQPAGHDDPTANFDWGKFIYRLTHMPRGGYDLSGTGFKL